MENYVPQENTLCAPNRGHDMTLSEEAVSQVTGSVVHNVWGVCHLLWAGVLEHSQFSSQYRWD